MILNKNFFWVVILILLGALPFFNTEAGSKFEQRTTTVDLQTNMICGQARKIIEKALMKVSGVIEASVETADRVAIVKYDDTKTSIAEIENAITKAGYDANDKKADPEAYDKLPDCCKTK